LILLFGRGEVPGNCPRGFGKEKEYLGIGSSQARGGTDVNGGDSGLFRGRKDIKLFLPSASRTTKRKKDLSAVGRVVTEQRFEWEEVFGEDSY